MVKVDVTKNRVQSANSLQAKCFVYRAMTGGKLVAVPIPPIFHAPATFTTDCISQEALGHNRSILNTGCSFNIDRYSRSRDRHPPDRTCESAASEVRSVKGKVVARVPFLSKDHFQFGTLACPLKTSPDLERASKDLGP